MRIAAQILQLCQFSKQRAASRIPEYRLELIKSGDFVGIKEVSYVLEMVFCLVHNETVSPYQKLCQDQCSHYVFIVKCGYIIHCKR